MIYLKLNFFSLNCRKVKFNFQIFNGSSANLDKRRTLTFLPRIETNDLNYHAKFNLEPYCR